MCKYKGCNVDTGSNKKKFCGKREIKGSCAQKQESERQKETREEAMREGEFNYSSVWKESKADKEAAREKEKKRIAGGYALPANNGYGT